MITRKKKLRNKKKRERKKEIERKNYGNRGKTGVNISAMVNQFLSKGV